MVRDVSSGEPDLNNGIILDSLRRSGKNSSIKCDQLKSIESDSAKDSLASFIKCIRVPYGPGSLEASRDDKRIICTSLQSVGLMKKLLVIDGK